MTELIDNLIKLTPEAGEDAKFYSYGYLWNHVWSGYGEEYLPDAVDIIQSDIEAVHVELYDKHDIAIQVDAMQGDISGIRLLRVS